MQANFAHLALLLFGSLRLRLFIDLDHLLPSLLLFRGELHAEQARLVLRLIKQARNPMGELLMQLGAGDSEEYCGNSIECEGQRTRLTLGLSLVRMGSTSFPVLVVWAARDRRCAQTTPGHEMRRQVKPSHSPNAPR